MPPPPPPLLLRATRCKSAGRLSTSFHFLSFSLVQASCEKPNPSMHHNEHISIRIFNLLCILVKRTSQGTPMESYYLRCISSLHMMQYFGLKNLAVDAAFFCYVEFPVASVLRSIGSDADTNIYTGHNSSKVRRCTHHYCSYQFGIWNKQN